MWGVAIGALKWAMGPLTNIAGTWIKAKNDVKLRRIEADMERDVLTAEVRERILDSSDHVADLTKKIINEDRRNDKTSWIRPFTAKLSIGFWSVVVLTELQWNGQHLSPLQVNVPDGPLGVMMVAFPAGVLATFYIFRPFEKMAMWRTA